MVVLLLVVAGLSSMLIPQLVSSIQSVLDALPENVNNFIIWVQQVLDNNQDVVEWIVDYTDQALEWGKSWGKNVLAPNLDKIIGSLSSGMFSVVIWLKNILIGLIVMVYLLNMKDDLATIAKNACTPSCRWSGRTG